MPADAPRLELTWPNKDKFLLSPKDDSGRPVWVDRHHPAASEVRLTDFTAADGEVDDNNPYGDNLLFVGDSIDALRVLAEVPEYRREYRGKIKLCYIDPPFNSLQAFTHYDDWMEHSTWLSFMRERLLVICDLLASDGSVWIHLDDHEVHRMRCLMDEVMGPANYVAEMHWEKTYSPRNDSKGIPAVTDTILVYSKNPAAFVPNRLPRTSAMDARYLNPDDDPRGLWKVAGCTAPGAVTHQGMVYAIQHPITGELMYPTAGRHWSLGQTEILNVMQGWAPYELRDINDAARRAGLCGIATDSVRAGVRAIMLAVPLDQAAEQARGVYQRGQWPTFAPNRGGMGNLFRKVYLSDVPGRTPVNLLPYSEAGHTDGAKRELRTLFPGTHLFDTPKPERLMQRVITLASNPGDIVLDCFAGSGTTAAVAHKMGRRWVTAELSSDTVDAFTVPRLRKVVDGTDQSGVSTTTQRVPMDGVELPEGITPEQAQVFATLLGKVVKSIDTDTLDDRTLRALRAATRTRDETSVNWAGGGGFRQVQIAPSMYETTPVGVMLTDEATNGRFARAVAGQLGFEWQDKGHAPFCGVRGRMRLAVFDGAVGTEEVRAVVAALDERERVTIVGKTVLPDAEQLLRETSKGSVVRKAPRDLLSVGSRRSRRRAKA